MASGRYIVSANTDDRSRPDAFELMADVLDHNLKAALVYSDVYFTNTANDSMNSSKEKKEHWESCRVPDYSHKELLLRAVCGPRPMWRRNLHDELGFFDESYLVAGDYEFWLRIAERYPLLHLPEFLCLYYLDENCLCLKHQDALQAEHRKIRKKYLNRGERS